MWQRLFAREQLNAVPSDPLRSKEGAKAVGPAKAAVERGAGTSVADKFPTGPRPGTQRTAESSP